VPVAAAVVVLLQEHQEALEEGAMVLLPHQVTTPQALQTPEAVVEVVETTRVRQAALVL
jgi:hypothetical protein